MPMCHQQPHQEAVAHSVNGLHDDLIERQAGRQLLSWNSLHPVDPVTSLLVKHVVMHTAILHNT